MIQTRLFVLLIIIVFAFGCEYVPVDSNGRPIKQRRLRPVNVTPLADRDYCPSSET